MQDLVDKHFTIFVIAILCIIEMVFTRQTPDMAWLFIAYGIYKCFIFLLEDV